jgi:hypothetical protein
MQQMTRRAVLAAVVVLTLAGVAEAQDLARFYIVPKIGDGLTPQSAFRPKYITELGVPWGAMDYGREDTMLAGAQVTAAQHTALAANLDVIAIPSNLDSNISAAALSTVQDRVESLKIPANWLTTNHTYRDVVRIVGKIFMLMQRFDGLHHRTFFDTNITLATTWGQLGTVVRENMEATATSLGLSIPTSNQTLRQVFRQWASEIPTFSLMGETF